MMFGFVLSYYNVLFFVVLIGFVSFCYNISFFFVFVRLFILCMEIHMDKTFFILGVIDILVTIILSNL